MAVGRQQAALPRPVHRRGLEVDGRGDAVRLDGRLDEADARILGQRRRIDQPHPRGRVHAVTAQRQIANRTRAVLEENRHRLARLDAVYHFLAELDLDVAGLLRPPPASPGEAISASRAAPYTLRILCRPCRQSQPGPVAGRNGWKTARPP